MSHYDITQWADFVRGLGAAGERAAMQRHLEGGCARCAAIAGALRRVATALGSEAEASPPEPMVRSVKAFFTVQHPEARAHWRELTLRRVFDSTLTRAPGSRRAPGDGVRQLLFESDEYTLELSVDRRADAGGAVLRGQLLAAHGEPRSHTPVFLVGGGEVIARTISERHGTFELTGRLDRPCELWVVPDDEHLIKLKLDPVN
jgi:hypothetical protein